MCLSGQIFEIRPHEIGNHHGVFQIAQDLRSQFSDSTIRGSSEQSFESYEHAIQSAIDTVFGVLEKVAKTGHGYKQSDPGHGVGHLLRDMLHAAVILTNLSSAEKNQISPIEVSQAFISGALHDMGTMLVDRYQDHRSINKHAEVGGIMYNALQGNELRHIPVIWAIMAHTNLRTTQCVGGRSVEVYKDCLESSEPIMTVWLTRMIDRLDTNGPMFIVRHFLARSVSRTDLTKGQNYTQSFAEHMQITNDAPYISGTMQSHLHAFLASQEDPIGVYSQYDIPSMVEVRRRYSGWSLYALQLLQEDDTTKLVPSERVDVTLNRFLEFCDRYGEPRRDPSGQESAYITDLRAQFLQLDLLTQQRWVSVFQAILDIYPIYIQELALSNEYTQNIASHRLPGEDRTIAEMLGVGQKDMSSGIFSDSTQGDLHGSKI